MSVYLEYTPFVVSDCPRCGSVSLSGFVHGLFYRVDPWPIPEVDVSVLSKYGFTGIVLDLRATGDRFGQPAKSADHSDEDVYAPHICESVHALSGGVR